MAEMAWWLLFKWPSFHSFNNKQIIQLLSSTRPYIRGRREEYAKSLH